VTADDARAALEKHGLLLLQDARLPSLVSLVAGGPVKGSWWGHPAGRAIFAIASALDDDDDVTTARLLAGKVTFVHRRLFAALAAVGGEKASWQLARLPATARTLLRRVEAAGGARASGPPAKVLERRLLVASRQVHTASGAHATELATWAGFRRATGTRAMSAARARTELEAAAAAVGGRALLPW
jgi:hypothetical protein